MPNFTELEKFIKEYQKKNFKERLKERKISEQKIKHIEEFGEVKASSIDINARTVEVIATKEVVDRQGDIIRIAGIDTNNFVKNPVVPFAHKYQELPVAKVISLKFDGDKLMMKLQFPTKEIYEFGDTVFKLFKEGYLNAVSIGFIPIKEAWDDELKANVIEKTELLEVSIVPVPANQEALAKHYFKVADSVEKDAVDEIEEAETEEKEENAVNEERDDKEKALYEEHKEILKKYRKYQVLLRGALDIVATEDEGETVDEVMKAALAVLNLVKKSVVKIQESREETPRSQNIKPKQVATQPVKAKESLVSKALRIADKL